MFNINKIPPIAFHFCFARPPHTSGCSSTGHCIITIEPTKYLQKTKQIKNKDLNTHSHLILH